MKITYLPSAYIFLGVFALLLSFGCNKYSDALESTDANVKYVAAKKAYEEKDYQTCTRLLDPIVFIFKGRDKGREIDYLRAMAYYNMGFYIVAADLFENFSQDYPNNEQAETALFLAAKCNHTISRSYKRDQTETLKAISIIERFIDLYPESDSIPPIRNILTDLRDKVEKKAYNRAKFYYDNEQYRSATSAFRQYVDQYYRTTYSEEAYFLKFKSNYYYAIKSRLDKRLERLTNAETDYSIFKKFYPESEFIEEADELYEDLLAEKLSVEEKQKELEALAANTIEN